MAGPLADDEDDDAQYEHQYDEQYDIDDLAGRSLQGNGRNYIAGVWQYDEPHAGASPADPRDIYLTPAPDFPLHWPDEDDYVAGAEGDQYIDGHFSGEEYDHEQYRDQATGYGHLLGRRFQAGGGYSYATASGSGARRGDTPAADQSTPRPTYHAAPAFSLPGAQQSAPAARPPSRPPTRQLAHPRPTTAFVPYTGPPAPVQAHNRPPTRIASRMSTRSEVPQPAHRASYAPAPTPRLDQQHVAPPPLMGNIRGVAPGVGPALAPPTIAPAGRNVAPFGSNGEQRGLRDRVFDRPIAPRPAVQHTMPEDADSTFTVAFQTIGFRPDDGAPQSSSGPGPRQGSAGEPAGADEVGRVLAAVRQHDVAPSRGRRTQRVVQVAPPGESGHYRVAMAGPTAWTHGMTTEAVTACLDLGSRGVALLAQLFNCAAEERETAPSARAAVISTIAGVSGTSDFECIQMEPHQGIQSTWYLITFINRPEIADRVLALCSNNVLGTDRAALNVIRPTLRGDDALKHLMVLTIPNFTPTDSGAAAAREAATRDQDRVRNGLLLYWARPQAQNCLSSIISAEHGPSQVPYYLQRFLSSVTVRLVPFVGKLGHFQPYFTVWAIYPVYDPERITVLRRFLTLVPYKTFETGAFDFPDWAQWLQCSYCHGIDHSRGLCEYLMSPAIGWLGPAPDSKLRLISHNPITHPVYGKAPSTYTGNGVSSTATTNADAQDADPQVDSRQSQAPSRRGGRGGGGSGYVSGPPRGGGPGRGAPGRGGPPGRGGGRGNGPPGAYDQRRGGARGGRGGGAPSGWD
jgi:hypothetical protein